MTNKPERSVEEISYETRDYDGIRWIRLNHYDHALKAERQRCDEMVEAEREYWRNKIRKHFDKKIEETLTQPNNPK